MSKFLKFIVNLVLICAILIAGGLLIPPFLGVTTVVMDDADMDTNLDKGSVAYAKETSSSELETGDRILVNTDGAYVYEITQINGTDVITEDVSGAGKEGPTSLGSRAYKVALIIPFIGYASMALRSTEGLIIVGLAIVFLIILYILAEIWKPDDEDDEDEEEENSASGDDEETQKTDVKEGLGEEEPELTKKDRKKAEKAEKKASKKAKKAERKAEKKAEREAEHEAAAEAADTADILADDLMHEKQEGFAQRAASDFEEADSMSADAEDGQNEQMEAAGDTVELPSADEFGKTQPVTFARESEPVEENASGTQDYDTDDLFAETESAFAADIMVMMQEMGVEEPQASGDEAAAAPSIADISAGTAAEAPADSAVIDEVTGDAEAEEVTPDDLTVDEDAIYARLNASLENSGEGQEEEPEEKRLAIPTYTKDELLERAQAAGDNPGVEEDQNSGITLVDYSDIL